MLFNRQILQVASRHRMTKIFSPWLAGRSRCIHRCSADSAAIFTQLSCRCAFAEANPPWTRRYFCLRKKCLVWSCSEVRCKSPTQRETKVAWETWSRPTELLQSWGNGPATVVPSSRWIFTTGASLARLRCRSWWGRWLFFFSSGSVFANLAEASGEATCWCWWTVSTWCFADRGGKAFAGHSGQSCHSLDSTPFCWLCYYMLGFRSGRHLARSLENVIFTWRYTFCVLENCELGGKSSGCWVQLPCTALQAFGKYCARCEYHQQRIGWAFCAAESRSPSSERSWK